MINVEDLDIFTFSFRTISSSSQTSAGEWLREGAIGLSSIFHGRAASSCFLFCRVFESWLTKGAGCSRTATFENKEIASVLVSHHPFEILVVVSKCLMIFDRLGIFIVALIPWAMTPAQCSSHGINSNLPSLTQEDFKCSAGRASKCLLFPEHLWKTCSSRITLICLVVTRQ